MTVDSDLISRSALLGKKTRMTEYDESGCGVHVYVVRVDDIEDVPSVDAEPVRRGEWTEPYKGDIWDFYICSRCKYGSDNKYRYCPECGARMDVEVRDDA